MRSWMIGIVVGLLAVSLLPLPLAAPWLPLYFLLTAVFSHYRQRWACLCWGVFFGFAGGTLYGYALLDSRLSKACEVISLSVEGVIVSLPRRSPTREGGLRQRFEFRPDAFEPRHCEGPRRLLLSYYGDRVLHPGERWRFQVKLKQPWGLANPGSFNMQSWYVQSGIDGTGNVRDKKAVLMSGSPTHWLNYHAIRQGISERIGQIDMEANVRAILQALMVADKSGVSGRLWTLLQFYGINHLLVISGLHISITAGAGYLLGGVLARLLSPLGFVRLPGLLPAIIALAVAFAYAALAGFALATVRALCMLACFVLASLFNRSTLSANNLLLAAVVVLLFNPLSAVGSGFWLSFSAVACLLWLTAWRGGTTLAVRMLQTHGYMALAMIPLGAWWFGGVSKVAVLANLCLVPLVGLFVVPVALLGVSSNLLSIGLDGYLFRIAAWPLEQILPPALQVAEEHHEFLYTYLSPSPGGVLLALVALALVIVPLPHGLRLLIPVLALPILLPAVSSSAAGADKPARLTVLDVGQGTAIVFQSGENALVYDTGGGDPEGHNMANWVILPYLRAQGIKHLQALVISHRDNDHSSGAGSLRASLPVGQLIMGGTGPVLYPWQPCRAGKAWRWPTGEQFQILSPATTENLSSNNSSCVLQIHLGSLRLLLPGDIDAGREKQLLRYWREGLRSDVLLAGHHGSATSSSYTWLKVVQPRYTIFSSGYHNPFSHPRKEILERFYAIDSDTLITARDGAVELQVQLDGRVLASSFRDGRHPYWM